MRLSGREKALINEGRAIPCGSWVPMLAKKSYRRQQHCDRWSCNDCRARKIKKCQAALQGAKLAVTIYVGEKPLAKTDQGAKALSNFLGRKVKGGYWTVRSDSRIVIIAKSAFPEAVRLRSTYVIESLVPDVLNETWTQFFTKRFTRPHGQKEKQTENKDKAYAQWIGEAGGEEAMKAFTSLKNDQARAQFLLHHMDNVGLYDAGREILDEYQMGIEKVSLRGASPPEPPRHINLNEIGETASCLQKR